MASHNLLTDLEVAPQLSAVDRLIASLIGARGDVREVRFSEGGNKYIAYVPDDSLWGAIKDVLILSEYERASICLSRYTGVVVDAGAHVGLFTLRVSAHAQKVIALEPHPANRKLLEENLALNDAAGVTVIPKALWPSREGALLADGLHSGANSLLRATGETRAVPTITLGDVVSRVGGIDLLKLDIEGAEFPVLHECEEEGLRNITAVVAELHFSSEDQLVDLELRLRRAGFHVTILDPPSSYWRESITRVVRRWRNVQGLTRLKTVVLLLYTLGALWGLVRPASAGSSSAGLKFLYATRPVD